VTADLWSLLDQYLQLAAIAWWVYAVALTASVAIAVTGAGWAAWRIGRGIRRRAVRKAARHQEWVQGCDENAEPPEWGTAA
jgi:hypothetical protein